MDDAQAVLDTVLLSVEELCARYQKGERAFECVNLNKAALCNLDLRGISLQRSSLQWSDLHQTNLQGANLYGANLYGANLEGALFQRARYNLQTRWPQGFAYKTCGALGPETDLEGANLEGADLRGMDLRGAVFQNANLNGASLQGANLRGANLRDAQLQKANLFGTSLRVCDLRGANLHRALYNESTRWPEGYPYALADAFGPQHEASVTVLDNFALPDIMGYSRPAHQEDEAAIEPTLAPGSENTEAYLTLASHEPLRLYDSFLLQGVLFSLLGSHVSYRLLVGLIDGVEGIHIFELSARMLELFAETLHQRAWRPEHTLSRPFRDVFTVQTEKELEELVEQKLVYMKLSLHRHDKNSRAPIRIWSTGDLPSSL